MRIGSLDDDDPPGPRGRDRLRHLWPLIAGIGEDRFDEREAPPRLTQNIARAVAILHAVGMNDDAQQKPERVDETWRLRPVTFLPASYPCGSSPEPLFERLSRSGCR